MKYSPSIQLRAFASLDAAVTSGPMTLLMYNPKPLMKVSIRDMRGSIYLSLREVQSDDVFSDL